MKHFVFLFFAVILAANAALADSNWVAVGAAKSNDRLLSEQSAYSDLNVPSYVFDARAKKSLDFLGLEQVHLLGSLRNTVSSTQSDLVNMRSLRLSALYSVFSPESSWQLEPGIGLENYANSGSNPAQAYIEHQSSPLLSLHLGYRFATGINVSATGLVALSSLFSHYEAAIEAGTMISERFELGANFAREELNHSAIGLTAISVRSLVFLKFKFGSSNGLDQSKSPEEK